ncbi:MULTISPECIES: outer membrane beta-barrel protein [Chitinophagaceae]
MQLARSCYCLFFATILLLLASIPNSSKAQYHVKGQLKDSIAGGMSNVVVAALRAKDSIMVKYIRSDKEGNFNMELKDSGTYVFLMTYPNYGDLVLEQSVGQPTVDLGSHSMVTKAKLLEEVIVKQTVAAVRMKGDTTEFTADSFRVQPNATVEDLLKKFPGIQVDKDGKITAQGQTVKKVLVDGEEFFGDDPTLVTKNLRADMVDKVQLYDKSSEQAAFTGINDGVKDKTLNIKLKEDKKKGMFGKLVAGGGTNGFHESSAMVNKFQKKEKIAAYGIVANTGKVGLSWQENDQYSSTSMMTILGDDGQTQSFFTMGGDDSWNGQYDGTGIPLSQTAGLHYNNKWNDNKQSLNTNYKMAQLFVNGNATTTTQNNLDTTIQYSNSARTFKNRSMRNKLDGAVDIDLDSTLTMSVRAMGQLRHTESDEHYLDSTFRKDFSLQNSSDRTLTNNGDNNTFSASLLLRKKFKKKGRTLAAVVMEDYSNINTTGWLYSQNREYDVQSQLSKDTLTDQLKRNLVRTSNLNMRVVYTEPLSKVSSLFVNYGLIVNNSHSNKQSFNKAVDGTYSDQDTTYSNEYQYDQTTHKAGIGYNFSQKKLKFNIGTNMMAIHYNQTDVYHNLSPRGRSFLNWNPNARLTYSFTSQRNFRFYYSGNSNQPSIDQIQPVRNNNDNFNVYVGNAGLKPSFRHSMSLNFSDYKMLTDRDFYLGAYGGVTENQITTNVTTDPVTGKNTYQYVNVNGNGYLNIYTSTYFKSKKWNLNYGFSPQFSYNRSVNFSNSVKNIGNTYNYSLDLFVRKSKDSLYDFNFNITPGYNINNSSLQKEINNNFFSLNVRPNITFYVPKKFEIHADVDYMYQDKTETLSRISRGLVNASIGRKFLPGDRLMIKVSGFDLFNKNIGQNRSMYNNTISQTIYNTIRRYFLISATWNFTSGFSANK